MLYTVKLWYIKKGAETNIYFHYWFIRFYFFKYWSQFPQTQGNVFKLLVYSDKKVQNPNILNYNHRRLRTPIFNFCLNNLIIAQLWIHWAFLPFRYSNPTNWIDKALPITTNVLALFPESVFDINIFICLAKGWPVLPLHWDDKALIMRLTSCIWERLISQASSYSGVKVHSKSPPSPWIHLHLQPVRGHHFFPLIHSQQHSFGSLLPKSNTWLNGRLLRGSSTEPYFLQ